MAITARSLQAFDLGEPDQSGVPFVLSQAVPAATTTVTILPVLYKSLRVIDGWAVISTADTVGAAGRLNVRDTGGDAGGTLIASFDSGTATGRTGPVATASTIAMAPQTVTANGTAGLFIDKVGNADSVGTVYLLCQWV